MLFEKGSSRAGGEPAVFQALSHGVDFFLTVRLEFVWGVPYGFVILVAFCEFKLLNCLDVDSYLAVVVRRRLRGEILAWHRALF